MQYPTRLSIDPTIRPQYPILQGLGARSVIVTTGTVTKLQDGLRAAGHYTGESDGRWSAALVAALDAYWAAQGVTSVPLDPLAVGKLLENTFTTGNYTFTPEERVALAEAYVATKTPPKSWISKNWPWVAGGTAAVAAGVLGFLWWRRKQQDLSGCGCGR